VRLVHTLVLGERLNKDDITDLTKLQLDLIAATPKIPEWERIGQELRLVGEMAVHGELTVEGAAAELDARADRILEKRRWMLDHHTLPGGAQ
jgi:multiple sugar transport system substrate-binding protein